MFTKYSVYDWINNFCCMKLNWDDCQSIDEAREESIEQIEIQHVMRRIRHNESLLAKLVPKEEDRAMYLVEPKSL